MLSQLRVAFLRFHNTLVRQVKTASDPTHPAEIFAEAPWLTRWHDQWITLHEFLPETVGQTVVDNIFTKGRKFYSFAVAALPAHAEEDLISAPAPLQWPVKAGSTASSGFSITVLRQQVELSANAELCKMLLKDANKPIPQNFNWNLCPAKFQAKGNARQGNLTVSFSPGINIIIGENGTGKTHMLKAIYAACDVSKSQKSLAEKVNRVFLPSCEQIGRLVKRRKVSTTGNFEVTRQIPALNKSLAIRLSLSNHTKEPAKAKVSGAYKQWKEYPLESVYIPVKDMMANAPGFRSLYSLRHIHFEEVYADIIDRAFLGSLKGQADVDRKKLLEILQKSMDGKVVAKNEEFFLKNRQGELEFTLLAEGIRKLGLLWVLIQNGTLLNGSVLLWDEPETNLNPKLMRTVVEILIALQRMGV